uniref:Glycosyltransferase 61 catalytic domain-containing protein n=1 Tax=Dunaliella tertiolecta TaxID=3047 RepID=A0A7S3QL56_DUNTE|mmetsp:Transcript_20194/g.56254  ORF Transcript_20194/g.56254 Transcript_20194/m.56254 type:complete len:570 (+) Transcript_20194:149-1858(+)|eukprot:CAMPEP_0202348206 /NCGR_PEP_ID=MMETSP1126-20121109/6238_1 /ASSEMBLY_ACC=CAM_ASM_000457 /TAXON_ID=3047 /ORGANISM="Dunaliella tertiolecta, Strain CCMP1320" /LENGTH=569 /DNA_ID=CAMNT_0048939865 /DNA_START=65 /DNA_END=1774 /DNA_ORIENTATION=+
MGKAPEKGINRKLKRDKALARQPAPPRRYALAAVSVGMLALCMGVVLASSRPPKASNTPPPVQPGPPETPNTEKADWQDHMKQESQREKEVVIGDERFHPSFGVFPRGCKWKMVTTPNSTRYQWWDVNQATWVEERPRACTPTGFSPNEDVPPPSWNASASRSTQMQCDNSHCMYTNLYYNNGRWYALLDSPEQTSGWRFSRNQQVLTLHVNDVRTFTDSVKYRVVPGDTILFDFIFFTHPTAIGHWWEMLGPLYSILKRSNIKRPCDQFILLHLQRKHVLEWVRAMIAVTLGVKFNEELPPVYIQEPTDNAWSQITQILEGFDRDTWYMFEHVAITKDLYTGGGRTFLTRPDAQEFRSLVYRHYGLPPPQPRAAMPRIITYQRKRANRRVLNEDELIALLRNYGELQVVEYDSSSSLYEQLLQMRKTGVYVSVHTSNLANAPLLQPGSAVFELIHRNWHWNGLDTSFRDQTMTMGDIHHYAWRAQYINQTVYLDPRDFHKVAHWPASQCGTEECVEAHTRVDLYVDIPQVKQLLESRLPYVWANTPVYYAMLPWPPALDVPEDNVIPP